MDLFVLYLIGQLGRITTILFLLAIGFVFWALVLAAYGSEENNNDIKKRAFLCCKTALVLIGIGALLPSRESIMLMAAGKAVIEASKTDAAQSIAANSVKWLDGFVSEQSKKYEESK